jgi:hypothetical protein
LVQRNGKHRVGIVHRLSLARLRWPDWLHRFAAFLFEPSSRIYTLRKGQIAWTDSLGTSQVPRDFSESRVSTGGKVIYSWQATGAQI